MNKENPSFFHPIIVYFQNNSWILLCIILTIAILLRLPNLNESLWFDELWSTRMKLDNIALLSNLVLYDPHPPFYYIFMFFWIRLFGDSELSIRIPSLIFGILSIFLTYTLCLRFTGKRGAVLASFLLCVSPVHIWYSQEARPYSGTLFFLLLAIFLYYKLKDSKSNSIWYFMYFVALLFAVFSHYYVVVYLGIISIMCLFDTDKMKRKVLILNILILVSLISYLGLKSMFGTIIIELGYLRPFTFFELWMLFFNWFLFGNSLWIISPYRSDISVISQKPLMFFTQLVFLSFFIHGVIQILKESKKRENLDSLDLILYLFSLPIFLLGLNFIGFKNTYIERSMFVVLPFFYILLVKGITCFKYKSISVISTIFTITLCIVTLTSYFKKSDEWTVYKQNPDWRGAAHYFDDELRDTIKPFFAFTTTPATELTYYDSRFEEISFVDIQASNNTLHKLKQLSLEDNHFVKKFSLDLTNSIQSRREEIANARLLIIYSNKNIREKLYGNKVKTFYLIHNKYWSGDFRNLFKDVIKDSRFQLVGANSFKGLEILKFRVVS